MNHKSAVARSNAVPHLAKRVWWEGRRLALAKTFRFWQFLGVHVTPNHYYSPIPDTRRLRDSIWETDRELPGIDIREGAQLGLLQEFGSFRSEYSAWPLRAAEANGEYYVHNGSFESVDSEVLYCMIRKFRPRSFIEIGSGASTVLSAKALELNRSEGSPCRFVSIDPHPSPRIKRAVEGFCEVMDQPVESVKLDLFTALGDSDILFIDSTHVVRIGGDVLYEFLEILPRLATGVLIHVHDIFLPANYPRNWVLRDKRFWSEQYLLQAFLAFNSAFEVVWAGSYMHLYHSDALARAFPSYRPGRAWPGSFWIRRVA